MRSDVPVPEVPAGRGKGGGINHGACIRTLPLRPAEKDRGDYAGGAGLQCGVYETPAGVSGSVSAPRTVGGCQFLDSKIQRGAVCSGAGAGAGDALGGPEYVLRRRAGPELFYLSDPGASGISGEGIRIVPAAGAELHYGLLHGRLRRCPGSPDLPGVLRCLGEPVGDGGPDAHAAAAG